MHSAGLKLRGISLNTKRTWVEPRHGRGSHEDRRIVMEEDGRDRSNRGCHKNASEDEKAEPESRTKLLLLNDDYTPMEFVVHVLEKYFSKGREEATNVSCSMSISRGVGVCGVYTYEVAETKVDASDGLFARQHGHPSAVHTWRKSRSSTCRHFSQSLEAALHRALELCQRTQS